MGILTAPHPCFKVNYQQLPNGKYTDGQSQKEEAIAKTDAQAAYYLENAEAHGLQFELETDIVVASDLDLEEYFRDAGFVEIHKPARTCKPEAEVLTWVTLMYAGSDFLPAGTLAKPFDTATFPQLQRQLARTVAPDWLALRGRHYCLLRLRTPESPQPVHPSVRGLSVPKTWGYLGDGYQALTEPCLQHICLGDKEIAFITQNSYGVKCLNSLNVMFVDIDLDTESYEVSLESFPWGSQPWDTDKVRVEESQILAAIRDLVSDWGLTFEVYRTRNGFRLIEMS